MRNRVSIIAAIMFLASCSGSVDVQPLAVLTTDRSAYVPGSNVTARLTNASGETIYHGVCLQLQRRLGLAWAPGPIPQVTCPDIQMGLAAGDSAVLGTRLPAGTSLGTYRLFLPVEDSRGQPLPERQRVSNSFTVTQ